MDPGRWERVQALFHSAAELDQTAWPQFLEHECGGDSALASEVKRMLEQDGRASLLDRDVTEVAGDLLGSALSSSFRESSPYRIQRMLGEGGMGVVYLAERSDLGNLVAVKVLRDGWLSPDRRGRFAAEQRMLAKLNHPSIARLYDANTLPDGTPWFAMEYVDGVPLTEYCRRNKATIEERVRLIRTVAEAVQYAHEHGVVHRDLKPSNILVKSDGSLRLVDFGIAKQLDPDRAVTRTQFRPMTPAYASPEQLRGEPVGVSTDVYSLGMVLYELLAGELPFDLRHMTAAEAEAMITGGEPPRPSAAVAREVRSTRAKTAWAKLDALCVAAMQKDPRERYSSIAALIRDIDHYLNDEPLDARPDSWPLSMARFARRNWRVAAAMLAVSGVATALALNISRKTSPTTVRNQTVAVLPFENSGADHSLDFLSQTLADEIWRVLDRSRSLSLRSPQAGRKFSGTGRNLQKAGHELGVGTIASGRFFKTGDQLQVTMDLTDVENGRLMWRDVFDVPVENMVAMQAQVAAKTLHAMAPVLGATEFVTTPPAPKNDEAYKLYLQARVLPDRVSTDANVPRRAIAMLTRSVTLDPSYGPAWGELAHWYTSLAWWGNGGAEARTHAREANEKAAALDRDDLSSAAGLLYQRSSAPYAHQSDAITKGEAYRRIEDLLRRRPDNARLHFFVSWILRDVGLLDEASRECEASILIDAQAAGARSCGVTFMLLGDYSRAMDYLRMDPDSEVFRAMSIDVLLRQGKQREALDAMTASLPLWGGYGVLRASLEHRTAPEIASMASDLKPAGDPEINYFSAAHLAYAGQTAAALEMLKRTIDGGYCSFPAAKSDPMLSSLRATPQFPTIEAAGMACQNRFRRERDHAR